MILEVSVPVDRRMVDRLRNVVRESIPIRQMVTTKKITDGILDGSDVHLPVQFQRRVVFGGHRATDRTNTPHGPALQVEGEAKVVR